LFRPPDGTLLLRRFHLLWIYFSRSHDMPFPTSTLGHPVNTAGRRAFVAQRPFSTKCVAPPDHLAIQNVAHTSFVSVQLRPLWAETDLILIGAQGALPGP